MFCVSVRTVGLGRPAPCSTEHTGTFRFLRVCFGHLASHRPGLTPLGDPPPAFSTVAKSQPPGGPLGASPQGEEGPQESVVSFQPRFLASLSYLQRLRRC